MDILQTIRQADMLYATMSILLMVGIFALRAARWQLLLSATGEKVKYFNVLGSVGIGYFINSFTPKLGEIARCTSLQSNSGVPFAKSAGVVVSERVYDLLVLFLGLVSILILEMDRLDFLIINLREAVASMLQGYIIWSLGAGILLISAFLYLKRQWLMNHSIYMKISGFVKDFSKAIADSFMLKQYPLFILYTVLIWLLLIAVNYTFLLSLSSTEGESIYFAFIVLFAATIGWALPAPGGIGTSHFFVLQLFIVFGLPEDSGVAFGIYSNGLTFAFTIFFGLISVADFYMRKKKTLE